MVIKFLIYFYFIFSCLFAFGNNISLRQIIVTETMSKIYKIGTYIGYYLIVFIVSVLFGWLILPIVLGRYVGKNFR